MDDMEIEGNEVKFVSTGVQAEVTKANKETLAEHDSDDCIEDDENESEDEPDELRFEPDELALYYQFQNLRSGRETKIPLGRTPHEIKLRELYYDLIQQQGAIDKINRASPETHVQAIIINDFTPQRDEYTDTSVKELKVGEILNLLRGGDPEGVWVEGVLIHDERVASLDHICTLPSRYMAIYNRKHTGVVMIAIDEFDPYELYEQEAWNFDLLSFKYSDIIAVTHMDIQPGWSEGYVANRMNLKIGRFPSSFVVPLEKNVGIFE